ncbi:MAG: DUF6089 family protein [Bacteroidia bacterium]|nr:DUF6089 family protein [Bacteroidia bacterium]
MRDLRIFFFLVLVLFFGTDLSAQYRYDYFRVGVSAGTTHYLGDLDDDFTFKFTRPGVGITGSYRFNPFMTARLGFFKGWISATDANSTNEVRQRRNLSFRSPITEFSATVSFDFLPSDRSYIYRPRYTPYVFGGVGVFTFRPQAELGGELIDLQPLGTEGQFLIDPNDTNPAPYALTQLAIPMGAGVRFAIAKRWDLEIETGFRKIFTDYLDDVSGTYPNLDELRAQNPVAALLSDRIDLTQFPDGAAVTNGIRGDNTQQDWYIYTNVRINFIIDWVKCPSF